MRLKPTLFSIVKGFMTVPSNAKVKHKTVVIYFRHHVIMTKIVLRN